MSSTNKSTRNTIGLETLESRETPTSGIYGGILTIHGSANHDTISVQNNGAFYRVVENGVASDHTASLVTHRMVIIYGNSGDDAVYNLSDLYTKVYGGAGNDFVWNSSNATMEAYGEAGNDSLWGGSNSDYLYGGNDNDALYGFGGQDYLFGGAGNDYLYGGVGDDWLEANSGNDILYGEVGMDWLYGGADNDRLDGGDDNQVDRLFGQGGSDWFQRDFQVREGRSVDIDNTFSDFNHLVDYLYDNP